MTPVPVLASVKHVGSCVQASPTFSLNQPQYRPVAAERVRRIHAQFCRPMLYQTLMAPYCKKRE